MASDVPSLFAASLVIDQRKAAEAQLETLAVHAGFLPHLLQIVLDRNQPMQVRQAACLYFKNQIKRRWDDEGMSITAQDKATIRENLVASMVHLSGPSDKLVRTQVGESIAAVARSDFPDSWPDLVSRLVSALSPTDYAINISVLQTAHNIFAPWKSEIRSDRLYSTINLALSHFVDAYFTLFRTTASHVASPDAADVSILALLGDTMDLLFNLYYDLTAQDLPPAFEDAHDEFFGNEKEEGWLLRFLKWDPPLLRGDPSDLSPTAPMRIQTTILEICELYMQRYNELSAPRLPVFVRAVWELIGTSTQAVREDGVVAQAIKLLSISVKMGSHVELFRQTDTLRALCERIIVPSMTIREHEEEQLEDDPLEYIRRDLSLSLEAASSTRRHAAGELVRALMSAGLEAEVTHIVQSLVAEALHSYASNPSQNWKNKDTAIYLFTSIASLGSTASQGVTSTNLHVDVIKFFLENVYGDLQTPEKSAHPILSIDAIRFVHQFRYQLTKEQHLAVLPNLMHHLTSDNYVSYTYAAITIERILFIKRGNSMLLSHTDIQETAPAILRALFAKMQAQRTPQKIAENEYLMKCVMRVIITSRQTLTPIFKDVLMNLVGVLNEICKNPSNPNFDQYCFESIAALLRFVVAGSPPTLGTFEAVLLQPVQTVLQQDIDQYVPYVLQIVAQMLEMHTASMPIIYRELFPLLITPIVWQQKGSVPPLVRLIKAYLSKDAAGIITNNQLPQILGVVQQRLIPSKMNDVYGLELLEAVVTYVPVPELQKHFRVVVLTLLNRLQMTRTDKYAHGFTRFLCFMMASTANGLTPDFTISTVETIQPGLWGSLLENVAIPQIPLFRSRERKLVAVGLARLLTTSEAMLVPPAVKTWPTMLVALLQLLSVPEVAVQTGEQTAEGEELSSIDHEEQTAGYQAAYTRLAASATTVEDPVAYAPDAVTFVRERLATASADHRVQQQLAVVSSQTPLLSKLMA